MNTYRQVIYMVFDELKITSDDSMWETEHIVFVLNKFRALLLKQRYAGIKKNIPLSYYQTIPVLLNTGKTRSVVKIPSLVDLNGLELSTDLNGDNITPYKLTFVSYQRFKYVTFNKFLQDIIYCTIGHDKYLYVKGKTDLPTTILINGLLENPNELNAFLQLTTNPIDLEFPVEESALGDILRLTVEKLSTSKVVPDIEKNNATEEQFVSKSSR